MPILHVPEEHVDELSVGPAVAREDAEAAFVVPVGPRDIMLFQIRPHVAIPLHSGLARDRGQGAPLAAIEGQIQLSRQGQGLGHEALEFLAVIHAVVAADDSRDVVAQSLHVFIFHEPASKK